MPLSELKHGDSPHVSNSPKEARRKASGELGRLPADRFPRFPKPSPELPTLSYLGPASFSMKSTKASISPRAPS
jgi:hypothetical protein